MSNNSSNNNNIDVDINDNKHKEANDVNLNNSLEILESEENSFNSSYSDNNLLKFGSSLNRFGINKSNDDDESNNNFSSLKKTNLNSILNLITSNITNILKNYFFT